MRQHFMCQLLEHLVDRAVSGAEAEGDVRDAEFPHRAQLLDEGCLPGPHAQSERGGGGTGVRDEIELHRSEVRLRALRGELPSLADLVA